MHADITALLVRIERLERVAAAARALVVPDATYEEKTGPLYDALAEAVEALDAATTAGDEGEGD